jgi:phosphoenolpyruvate synthase/pyruvate phosphate dikinase
MQCAANIAPARLYSDRAIADRVQHAFDHETVALSAGVQQKVVSGWWSPVRPMR